MSEQTTDEFMKDLTEDERQFLRLMRYALKVEREKNRSFWRALCNAFLSGVQNGAAQAGAELKRLFKE